MFCQKMSTNCFCLHVFSQDWFGKSDPYLEIFREQGPGRHVLIHKTEVVKNTLNPHWRVFKLTMQALSGGNMDSSLLVSETVACVVVIWKLCVIAVKLVDVI